MVQAYLVQVLFSDNFFQVLSTKLVVQLAVRRSVRMMVWVENYYQTECLVNILFLRIKTFREF